MKKLTPGRKRLVNNFITYGMVVAAYIVLQALNAGGMISPSLQGQLVPICAYVVMAVSLNLVVGVSGELSLGHAGFMSVGAFSGVVAAMSLQTHSQRRPPPGHRHGGGRGLAGVAGVIVGVPVLRLRGTTWPSSPWPSARSSATSSTSSTWAWMRRGCTSPWRPRWPWACPRRAGPS